MRRGTAGCPGRDGDTVGSPGYRDRNVTEGPKCHPCHSIPMFPWEELDMSGGQSPCDTGTGRAWPCQPRAAASVPNKGGIQLRWRGAQRRFRCRPEPRSGSQKGPSRPQGCKGRGQKEPVGAGAAPCPALAPISGPEKGPAPVRGPCRRTDAVSSSAGPGLSHGLIPARGWEGPGPGNRGRRVQW